MANLEALEASRAAQEASGFSEPTAPARDPSREATKINELGLDPSQITPDIEKDLFEATYSPDELSGLTDYKTLVKGQSKLAGQAGTAMGEAQAAYTGFKPEQMMGVLEDALRTKTDVGAQPLGTSELFKDAGIPQTGVAGFTTLMQSMDQNSKAMQDRYGSFTNVLDKAGTFVSEEYKSLANNYEFAINQYNEERGRLDGMISNIVQQEQAMALVEREVDLFKEKENFLRGLEPTASEKLDAQEKGYTYVNGDYVPTGSFEGMFADIGDPNSDLYGECAYMSNRITTGESGDAQWLGNSFEDKIGKVTHYDNPTIGDKLVTKNNTQWGHASTVIDWNPETRNVQVVEWNKKGDHKMEVNDYNIDDLSNSYSDTASGEANWGFVEANLKPEIAQKLSGISDGGDMQFDQSVIDWGNQIMEGEAKITAVPKELRDDVNRYNEVFEDSIQKKIDDGTIEKGGMSYNTLPQEKQLIAELASQYKVDPAKVESIRSGARSKIFAAARELNPDFDPIKLPGKYKFYQSYQSGDFSENMRVANEIAGDLEVLNEKASALGTTWLPKWNAIEQTFKAETGKPEVKAFRIVAQGMSQKLGRLFKGGKGVVPEAEAERWLKELVESESPEQMRASYAGVMELVGMNIRSMREQYERTMEETIPQPIFSEESKRLLLKNGIDSEEFDPTTESNEYPKGTVVEVAGQKYLSNGDGTFNPQ